MLQKWFTLNNHPSRSQVEFDFKNSNFNQTKYEPRLSNTQAFSIPDHLELADPNLMFTTLFTGSRTPELLSEERSKDKPGIMISGRYVNTGWSK